VWCDPEGVGTCSPGLLYSATLGYGVMENVGVKPAFTTTLKELPSAVSRYKTCYVFVV